MQQRRFFETSACIIVMTLCLAGCTMALVDMRPETNYYKRDLGKLPQVQQQSFSSQQAAGAAAALQSLKAAKLYYQGCEPLSEDANTLYMLSYRFMGLCGINMDFDPNDPESVEKVFAAADGAVKEKDKAIADLKQEVSEFTQKLAEKEKVIADKGTELENTKTTLKARMGSLYYAIIAIALVIIGLLIFGQVMTGVPFPKLALGFITGGIKTLYKFGHQTGEAIMEWKKDREADMSAAQEQITNGGTEIEKARAAGLLEGLKKGKEELSFLLEAKQDKDVKKLVANTFNKGALK